MKAKALKALSTVAILANTLVFAPGVFADNPYGIEYTGGEPLGANNVIIEPNLVKDLTPLITSGRIKTVDFSNSSEWIKGYRKDGGGQCTAVRYLKVRRNQRSTNYDDVYYTVTSNQYVARITIDNFYVDAPTYDPEDELYFTISIAEALGTVAGGYRMYEDNTCETPTSDTRGVSSTDDSVIFVKTNIRLFDKESGEIFTSDKLYFGLTDIDASQSFKILNSDNLLAKTNMYALSADALQPEDFPDSTTRNMYVEDGHYIYAEGNYNIGTNKNNIFIKVSPGVQSGGLDVVFGYHSGAGSNIQYYAKQHRVAYFAENGVITGITDEDIISGYTPNGTTTQSVDNSVFQYWVANRDVKLKDGTIIKAKQPLTMEQIEQVIVDDDVEFTAIYLAGEDVKVPNTGSMPEEKNGELIGLSLIALVAVALLAYIGNYAHKRHENRVKF